MAQPLRRVSIAQSRALAVAIPAQAAKYKQWGEKTNDAERYSIGGKP
jgi:hypothetical protein